MIQILGFVLMAIGLSVALPVIQMETQELLGNRSAADGRLGEILVRAIVTVLCCAAGGWLAFGR